MTNGMQMDDSAHWGVLWVPHILPHLVEASRFICHSF